MTTGGEVESVAAPDFSEMFGHMLTAFLSMDWQYLFETVAPVFWPMLVSSLPTGVVAWIAIYWPVRRMVEGYHRRRLRRRERRRKGQASAAREAGS